MWPVLVGSGSMSVFEFDAFFFLWGRGGITYLSNEGVAPEDFNHSGCFCFVIWRRSLLCLHLLGVDGCIGRVDIVCQSQRESDEGGRFDASFFLFTFWCVCVGVSERCVGGGWGVCLFFFFVFFLGFVFFVGGEGGGGGGLDEMNGW